MADETQGSWKPLSTPTAIPETAALPTTEPDEEAPKGSWKPLVAATAPEEPESTPTSWRPIATESSQGEAAEEPAAGSWKPLTDLSNTSHTPLTNEEFNYGQYTKPEVMEDEPWYSKAWDWMNSPLYDLHKWGVREGAGSFERGLETGLEDIGSGLISPLMIGLMVASFGGAAGEAVGIAGARTAGITALKALGVNELAAPVVAGSVNTLMTAGFTAQMIGSLITQSPQFLDALKDGDVEQATRLGTNILATGIFLKKSLAHGFDEYAETKMAYRKSRGIVENPSTTENLRLAAEIAGKYYMKMSMANDAARAKAEEFTRQLKAAGAEDRVTQAAIRHYITQDGDVARIAKMEGVARGTIGPREYTPEEQELHQQAAELRKWASESVYTNKDTGEPTVLYTTEPVKGAEGLGTPLTQEGRAENASYVQIKKVNPMGNEAGLQKYIEQSGGEEAAKADLQKAGFDGISFTGTDGKLRVIAFSDNQIRPVEQYEAAKNEGWNREHAYIAVDKKNLPQIRTSGIGVDPEKNNIRYYASPKEALDNAAMPPSGNKNDLVVLTVPREEIEADTRESAAATRSKAQPRTGATGPAQIYPGVELKSNVDLKNGKLEIGLHDIRDKKVGQILVGIDKSTNTAHVNDAKIESGPREVNDKSLFRGRGYGKAMYLEAMRVAKENDVRYFSNDAGGATSLDARYVWDSLARQFEVKEEHDEGIPRLTSRYTIDLSKIPMKDLEPQPLKVGPVPDDMLVAAKRHMPGTMLERDADGNFTGVRMLRPQGAEDLPGDMSRVFKTWTPEEKDLYLEGLGKVPNLTPEQIEIAKTLRKLYDNSFLKANDHGLIRSWVQSYHPQAWANDTNSMWSYLFGKTKEPVTNEALNQLRHDTDSGRFDTNINAAKHRAYQTEFEGVMAGEKFKTDDLALHVQNHLKAIEQAIAAQEYLEDLRAKRVQASDGRPAVVLAGTARKMGGDENPALAVNPNAVKSIRISPEKVQEMSEGANPQFGMMSQLEWGLKNGYIEKLPWTTEDEEGVKRPAYAWSTENYVSIDHPSMRGWGFAGVDTAGNPAIMHGNLVVHPDFADHVRQVIGADQSIVRKSAAGRFALKASGEAKGLLLSISPFHIAQEGLRAMMVGINPFDASHIDINDSPTLQLGVKNGLIRGENLAKDQFSTGYASHSTLVSKIPGLNRFQSWMQSFLFEKYIPSLKDRSFTKLFEDVRNANPELTDDEAAHRAASMTNDVFGGLNYRQLGMSASTQDFARLAALAPDWLISEARMLGRAAGMMDPETRDLSRKMMIKQMAAIWLGTRALNMVASGQMHNEAPFGVVHKNEKGEETVYAVRFLPTDLIHAISRPGDFIRGRVNPLIVRPMIEGVTGRDAFGRRVTPATEAADIAQNFVPIAAQGLTKHFLGASGDLNALQLGAKAAGLSPYRYNTEAEKLAQQYASDRMESGPVNPENLRAHQEDIRLEDAYRKGQVSKGEIMQKVSKRRADEIVRRAPMAPLQARFDRLPLSEAINVWDVASRSEKDQLASLLWKKRVSFIKQHNAAQRIDDPTWRKLQHVYADLR
jgi:hypothetical protein